MVQIENQRDADEAEECNFLIDAAKVAVPAQVHGPFLDREYLTDKEVAEMTTISVAKLRSDRMQRKGIPYLKIGRCVRYKNTDVINYMQSIRIDPKKS